MEKTIAVIGAGLVGRAWAMVFARAGWRVRVHDRDAAQLRAAQSYIATSLDEQAEFGLVADPDAARARASYVAALDEALAGVDWVQESLPETLEVKREAFAALDRLAPADAVPRELDVGDPGIAVHRGAARARAMSRCAPCQSAAPRADRRALRRAVDFARRDRARAARVC